MKTLLHLSDAEITVERDLTKVGVQEVFKRLKRKAKLFEKERTNNEVFCFHVRWIGWDVEFDEQATDLKEFEEQTREDEAQRKVHGVEPL